MDNGWEKKASNQRFPPDAPGSRRGKRPGSAEIADALRAEFAAGTLRIGAALPSVDALRRRFGAGEWAVRHALQALRDDGLVVLRPRIGARITDKAHLAWRGTVAFICTSGFGAYYPQTLALCFGQNIEKAGWRSASVFIGIGDDGAPDFAPLRRHMANGVDFAVGLFGRPDISSMLDRAGIPHIVINGFTRDFPKARAVLKCDIETAFGRLIGALKERGVKSILEFDIERMMDRSFKAQLAANGFDVHQVMHTGDIGARSRIGSVREVGYREVADWFADERHRRHLPDVILFDDDYFASGGIAALLEAGLRIPHDVGVASFMNKGDEPAFGRRITGFGCDPKADGRAIADYVAALLDGGTPRTPRLAWRFFPGESL